MSICHIKIKKCTENKQIVAYEIYSFDFNPKHEWEIFGNIEINKITGSYIHKDNDLWEKNKIFPIDAFETPLDQRKELKETKYKGYSSALWANNIFSFIKKSLETKIFPDEKDLIS
jgi:hypothetical protein